MCVYAILLNYCTINNVRMYELLMLSVTFRKVTEIFKQRQNKREDNVEIFD